MGQQHAALEALDREIAASVARRVIDTVRDAYPELPDVLAYLTEVERDVVDNVEGFVAKNEHEMPVVILRALHGGESDDTKFRRYEVNVMIDHGTTRGAPVICEDHPTYANLIGRIEHMSELGTLVTDFTLIRPGALHRANGGYLLLDAIKVLQQPLAWEALKRALRTREIRIESLGHVLGLVSTVSLEPEAIPLDKLSPGAGTLGLGMHIGDEDVPVPGGVWQGRLDEVRFYRRPLAVGEVVALHREGVAAIAKREEGGNQQPSAVAACEPTVGLPPLEVKFDASDSKDPEEGKLTYAWDFGDGTTGTGVTNTHTYAKLGRYAAKITVTDDKGSSVTIEKTIRLQNEAPKVEVRSYRSEDINLDASASVDPEGKPLKFTWTVAGQTYQGPMKN